MKKLLVLLLVFSFAFSLSAAPAVQGKIIEKVKIEKSVIADDAVINDYVNCLKSKEFPQTSAKFKDPVCSAGNYIYVETPLTFYEADISRKCSGKFKIII
jgi:hypothetical protein